MTQMPEYPAELPGGADTTLELRHDLYAIAGAPAAAAGTPLTLLHDDTHRAIAIYQGTPGPSAEPMPVYAVGGDGPLAVPTGWVFVRLAKGMTPAERQSHFESAGFTIQRLLPYAPQAAWLRPTSGGIAHGISAQSLTALRAIAGVEHVEPQLLMTREKR